MPPRRRRRRARGARRSPRTSVVRRGIPLPRPPKAQLRRRPPVFRPRRRPRRSALGARGVAKAPRRDPRRAPPRGRRARWRRRRAAGGGTFSSSPGRRLVSLARGRRHGVGAPVEGDRGHLRGGSAVREGPNHRRRTRRRTRRVRRVRVWRRVGRRSRARATRIRGSVRGSSFARPDAVVASLVRRASARADADYGDFDRSPNPLEGGFDGGGVIFSGGSLGGALASEAAPSGGGGCGDVHERLGASALPPGHPARHRLRHSASVRTRDVFAADDHLRRRFDARDPWGESGSVGDAAGVGARGGHAADPFSFSLDGGDAPGSSSSAASGAAASAKLQSALLALAATHAAFAHAPEARKALDEATRAAQQRGDEVALAHALAHRVALEENNFPTNEGSSIREDDRTRASIADGAPSMIAFVVVQAAATLGVRGVGSAVRAAAGPRSLVWRRARRRFASRTSSRSPSSLRARAPRRARSVLARAAFLLLRRKRISGRRISRSSRRRGGRGRRRRGRRRRRRRGGGRGRRRVSPRARRRRRRGDVRARAQADGPRVRARARRARGAARREPRARVRARERRGRCENTLERRRARDESRGGGACVGGGRVPGALEARAGRGDGGGRGGAHQGARRVRIRARGGDVGRARRAEPREARRAQAPPSRRRRFVPPFERRESFGSGGRR